jgi:MinD-like ATPase involved in chromosome partitioning or flagellar assembly
MDVRERWCDRTLGVHVSRIRAWLDASPIADLAITFMREATGRADPVEPLRPTRPAALADGRRVAFWSLVGGVGCSTVAGLVAHRSAAGGRPPLLVDLDRWAPSLALRARLEAATIADALVQPGRERALVSRWAAVPFLPGSPALRGRLDIDRTVEVVDAIGGGAPVVIDLGTGADSLDGGLLSRIDRLCVVAGARASQLQAVFCALPLVRSAPCPAGLVVVGAAEEDAALIAERAALPLLGAIPTDPYLADDQFATRATTLRAIDALIRRIA